MKNVFMPNILNEQQKCEYLFQAIDAKKIKEVMMKYVYDKCPAVAAVGEYLSDYVQMN